MTIQEARRDKLALVLDRALQRIADRLVSVGMDTPTARLIAASRMFGMLPAGIRNDIASIESAAAARVSTIVTAIRAASTVDDIAAIDIE